MARRGGWRRRGTKRFRYVDARDRPITDERHLRRIEELVIPPAWRDVWISPNPVARLQATGVDRAGRRQYLYHPAYRAAQEERKYDRLVLFGERLPGLRETVAGHLELEPYERDRVTALAVTLVNRGWFRVGSERYARQSRTYGVTTLTKRHVSVRGHRLEFRFRSKQRLMVRRTIVDDQLAAAVRELLALPGGARLFRFERNGGTANLTGAMLNEYIGEHLAEGYTAKDFRTWGGTLEAALGLAEHGPPESPADERRILAAVMRRVGEQLGNTPTVARTSYVSPAVIEQWRDGRTLEHFRERRLRVVSARGLAEEEAALLSLLRSWRIRRSRAAA
jgi:DNA topoisomerase-1